MTSSPSRQPAAASAVGRGGDSRQDAVNHDSPRRSPTSSAEVQVRAQEAEQIIGSMDRATPDESARRLASNFASRETAVQARMADAAVAARVRRGGYRCSRGAPRTLTAQQRLSGTSARPRVRPPATSPPATSRGCGAPTRRSRPLCGDAGVSTLCPMMARLAKGDGAYAAMRGRAREAAYEALLAAGSDMHAPDLKVGVAQLAGRKGKPPVAS